MSQPVIVTIFGITGDLSRKKIIPALFRLRKFNYLPKSTRFIGVGRRKLTSSDFNNLLTTAIGQDVARDDEFVSSWRYVQGQLDDPQLYCSIAQVAESVETRSSNVTKIFHLAVAPEFFELIGRQLAIMNNQDSKIKIMIEKPIGHDQFSAKHLNQVYRKLYNQNQIFRVDHYLGKSAVRALIKLKLDPNQIDHIQLILTTPDSINARGDYYDRSGEVRDMIQNHALSVLSMLLVHRDIQSSSHVKFLDLGRIEKFVVGQYASYHSDPEIKPNSLTPTFIAVKLYFTSGPWQDIPIYIKSGKKLRQKKSLVYIKYKQGDSQRLDLDSPNKSQLNDYEQLYLDVVNDDQTYFLNEREVESAWKLIDPLLAEQTPNIYSDNSDGPAESNHIIEADHRRWIL